MDPNAIKMNIKIEINPQMCRLCFKDSVPLHCSIDTCQEFVQNIAQIQLQPDEHLPNQVCKGCFKMLEIGNEIRKRCLESVTLFNDILSEKAHLGDESQTGEEDQEILYEFKVDTGGGGGEITCCMCSTILDDVSALIEHRTSVHKWEWDMKHNLDVENERCLSCMKLFDDINTKQVHRTCQECLETFFSDDELVQHQEEMHLDQMDTEYLENDEVYVEENDLEIGDEMLQEEVVLKVIDQSELVTMSTSSDDPLQPRKKRAYEKSAITIEREKNREKKRKAKYGCCQCTAESNTKAEMKEHFSKMHPQLVNDADVWGHACFLCNTSFESRQELLKHINAPRTEVFPCDISGCNEVFQSQFQLRKHFDTNHYGQHIFECDQCDKVYHKQMSLNHHKYIMHDIRSNFYCDKCDKTFHRKAFWKEHMNSHYGIKTHQCKFCDAAFARRTGLQAHLRKHTGEKPYQCTDCDKRYSHFTDLKRHRYTHTGEYPFMCSHCDKGFAKKAAYETHMNNHAKKGISTNVVKMVIEETSEIE